MSNIKWSGIEQWKYGLTARWYVSAYYGNDIDVDGVGLYNPSTNPTGHGGPTRPFATDEKLQMDVNVGTGSVVVYDSGYYNTPGTKTLRRVGDGHVTMSNNNITVNTVTARFYNFTLVQASFAGSIYKDCKCYYCNIVLFGNSETDPVTERTLFVDCTNSSGSLGSRNLILNCTFVNHNGYIANKPGYHQIGNIFIGNSQLRFLSLTSLRSSNTIFDYSIIIGAIAQTNIPINGKTTGVTVEDFKADSQYFRKSFSEVDLFGNASGSGATVSQLNEIFNNFYFPYIDDYHNLDLTLRPDCAELVRFGGLNGTYIGALPVGYRLSASELWNTHIDTANTSSLDYDLVNNAIVLASGQDAGTYTSLIIDLGAPIVVDMVDFLANFVYNIEGTAKQGVSNQRIDTTPDLLPDNTENQRVVYDYRLQYSPDGVTALTGWENLELNRMPTKDGAGLYQLEDGFNQATAQKLTIQRLKIEFTLRRVIIA